MMYDDQTKYERFRVLRENGYGEVERQVRELERNGYEIVCVEDREVPFCMGTDGNPVMVPGWSIVTKRPKPPSQAPVYYSEPYQAPGWLW